jgi:asparagine synthase (glutamine-hydrolysing)
MCGIAGALITHAATARADLTPLLKSMIHAIRHRGPDDTGIHEKNGVAFAHARLSVIDLSAAGHQPMMTKDESIRVVFNGEIYNFPELRQALLGKGYEFKSHTDTEVILHGYHLWGKAVFSRLRGMFAIAIWDDRTDELVLARDRVGKKPLFFAMHQGLFLFGSEIKAILAYPGFMRQPDLQAIHHYLSLQYVPSP